MSKTPAPLYVPPPDQYDSQTLASDLDSAQLPKYTPRQPGPTLALRTDLLDHVAYEDRHGNTVLLTPPGPLSASMASPAGRRPLPPIPNHLERRQPVGDTMILSPHTSSTPLSPFKNFPPMISPPHTFPNSPSSASLAPSSFRSPNRQTVSGLSSSPEDSMSLYTFSQDTGHRVTGKGFDLFFNRGDLSIPPIYGRGDRVEGSIEVKNQRDIIQIDVTFEGILNITFTEHGLPYDQTSVPLFSIVKPVCSSDGAMPRPSYPFTFEFPPTIPSSKTPLPPTWHIHHPGAEADVVYQIRVQVIRKRMLSLKSTEKLMCKVDYYPRCVPSLTSSSHDNGPRKRDITLAYNMPPLGHQIAHAPLNSTTLTTVFSLTKPLVYASGSTIQYSIAFSCKTTPSVPALMTGSVTLLKSQTAILHGRKSSKETIISRGKECQGPDFRHDADGGTRIHRGEINAGREGEEKSWKLEGMAEVKYTLLLVVAPKKEFQEQFTDFTSLPKFEHREEIVLTTDSVLDNRAEAHLPVPAMVMRRTTSGLTAVTSTSSGSSGETRRGPIRQSGDSFLPSLE